MKDRILHYRCEGLCDAAGLNHAQAALLLQTTRQGLEILALGSPAEVARHPAASTRPPETLHHEVIIPGLVNAHTHLDLTHMGPLPYSREGGFVGWVDRIRSQRATEPAEIIASVNEGIRLSLAGGVIAVGDIAGIRQLEPLHALRESPLIGVSYLEVFGMGARQADAVSTLRKTCSTTSSNENGVCLGLQPHAPYSAGLDVFAAAIELREQYGTPLCTHLAETSEERSFVADAAGPIRAMLERLGVWDDRILAQVGQGRHPLHHLSSTLNAGGWLAAHVNDLPEDGLDTLARSGASIVYCPRCSTYFDHAGTFGPHRYRDMIDAGINVALGTDSIINLPDADRISTFDEMQLLHRRDGVPPARLMRMATVNGARALGLPEIAFTLQVGHVVAGLAAVRITEPGPESPLEAIMKPGTSIRMLQPEPSP